MKWIIRIVIVLVVLIGAGLWFGWSQLGALVKFGIEKGTPPVVQTSVSVQNVKLSPFSGTGVIEGFEIGNPKGFTGPYALRIGRTEVAVDTNSVSADKVVIQFIRITDPEINLEAGLGGTNLKHIADNAKNFVSQQTASAGQRAPSAAVPPADGKPTKSIKFQVNELLITGAKLSANAAGLVPGADARMTLPDIRLTNLGTGSEGMTPAELTALVLRQLNTEAVKASASGAFKNMLQGGTEKIKAGGLKGLFGK
ncbi:MAG: hypothetical protein K9N47_20380 [Prosthecobacter sp.]|uniref:hypothetical protein n=1 Tax=Prosthecobacter sp. TaxID=1965333 RepID=UPI00261C4D11|nr:hypothetical protein [Prosthecobacter sp.]MCF7788490.1 hypothetical protein [Prosthecobacter sp.]